MLKEALQERNCYLEIKKRTAESLSDCTQSNCEIRHDIKMLRSNGFSHT